MHRVGVVADADGAETTDTHRKSFVILRAVPRQCTQHGLLPGPTLLTTGIDLVEELAQEGVVFGSLSEIALTAQHQRLIHRPAKTVMALLDIPVFVRTDRIGLARLQPVMPHQGFIALGEVFRMIQRMDGGTEAVGYVGLGHATQFPQGVLQTVAQTLETFGEANRRRLPVRVGQREVINQMLKELTLDRHPQRCHVREIGGAQLARLVGLREVDFFSRSFQRPPDFDPSLQGAQLAILKAPRIATLEIIKQGFRLKARIVVEFFLDLMPYISERVGARPPGVLHAVLAGQSTRAAILARGLLVHPGLGSSHGQRSFGALRHVFCYPW